MKQFAGYIVLVVTVLMLCGIRSGAQQKSKTLRVTPQSGDYANLEFYNNSHALIIGINKYANLPSELQLDFAENDATELRDILIRSYGFAPENITVLLSEQATKQNIDDALAELTDSNRVKPNDRVLVYFSGHGQTVQLQNGGEAGFLIPSDAKVDLNKTNNPVSYRKSCLSMNSIWESLELCPARHRLIVVDACISGLWANAMGEIVPPLSKTVVSKLLHLYALQLITAGGKNKKAQQDPKFRHSIFTKNFLEQLKSKTTTQDTVFVVSEIAIKVKMAVIGMTDGKQTPVFVNHDTEGEFLFVTTKTQNVPALLRKTIVTVSKPKPRETSANISNSNSKPRKDDRELDGFTAKFKKNAKDSADMIFIPAGEFTMGSNEVVNEKPIHKVHLDSYYIYRTPVTVKQYLKFCEETGYKKPNTVKFNPNWSKQDHPIVNVSYNDALEYCKWASGNSPGSVRLPTEAEWEKAACWDDAKKQKRKFPWGNVFSISKLWGSKNKASDAGGTKPVGSFPSGASPYDVLDMAGNVCQWCSDWYDMKFYESRHATDLNVENQSVGEKYGRVVRGGSWVESDSYYFHSTYRDEFAPTFSDFFLGFRCVSK